MLSFSVVPSSLPPHGCGPPGSSVHVDSPGKNTGVGCHAFLHGICPTQGSNLGLLHCRMFLYNLDPQWSPRILEWVVYPISRGSSQPRNQTGSPALQADSLPTELSGKPPSLINHVSFGETMWYLKANTRSESFSSPTTRWPSFIHPFISSTSHTTWRTYF